MEVKNTKPIVFLVCTGLGRINRGYETFSRECFEALKENNQFKLLLFKGEGKTKGDEFAIINLHRNNKFSILIAKLFHTSSYLIEQFSFCFFLLPNIIRKKPSVIYYSDFLLGTYLWHLRKIFQFRYKLLFSNGAPNGAPFKTEDHVQQLLPIYLDDAIQKGESPTKHTLLPYGFDINIQERISNVEESKIRKKELNIPDNSIIILSVGAVNKYHKRMDYVINEIAKLPENFFLIILGQFEDETGDLIKLANEKLPLRHRITSVDYNEIKNYYIIADYFVLASLAEGFGRVLIEASSYGLPCIVNNHTIFKQVLNDSGIYMDMAEPNSLYKYLIKPKDKKRKMDLIQFSFNTYSWSILKDRYLKMISELIK